MNLVSMNRRVLAFSMGLLGCTRPEPPPTFAAPTHPWLPPAMIWAWHGRQDLSGLDPDRVGVAYLARTLHIGPQGVDVTPRHEAIILPPNTTLLGVVRIEIDPVMSPEMWLQWSERMIDQVLVVAGEPHVRGVQIDFDAPTRFRSAYVSWLSALRSRLPQGQRLSMTALASWCFDDRWLDRAPVDVVVPMMFAIGSATAVLRTRLEREGRFAEPACSGTLGLSMDEPWPSHPSFPHLWFFGPGSWTPKRIAQVEASIATPARVTTALALGQP